MSDLREFLEITTEERHEVGIEFELEVLSSFCDFLGIDQDYLYRQPTIPGRRRPDGMIADGLNKKPWAVLEVKYSKDRRTHENGKRQTAEYRNISGANYGILIAVGYIWVIGPSGKHSVNIRSSKGSEIEKVEKILRPPDTFPTATYSSASEAKEKLTKINKPHFELDVNQFEKALAAVDTAKSTQEKGDTFEVFANLLLGGIPYLRVRDRKLQTRTGEIDLVVEYLGSNQLTIFDEWSRFILVECKNWSSSVGVSQVRDFKGKMDKAQVDLGIIFARNGLSGDESENALRWIHDYFQREGRIILVVGDDQIQQVRRGESFYQLLDEGMYQRRFDFN